MAEFKHSSQAAETPPPPHQTIVNSVVNEQVSTPNYELDKDTSAKANSEDCITTKSEENIHKKHTQENIQNTKMNNGARDPVPPPIPVTYEYLHNNFTKPQLQEYCRNLGMLKIWTTKDKLIEKILSNEHNTRNVLQCSASESTPIQCSSDNEKPDNALLLEIIDDKNAEIEHLTMQVNEQNSYMLRLRERLATLEADPSTSPNAAHHAESPASLTATPDSPEPLPSPLPQHRKKAGPPTHLHLITWWEFWTISTHLTLPLRPPLYQFWCHEKPPLQVCQPPPRPSLQPPPLHSW